MTINIDRKNEGEVSKQNILNLDFISRTIHDLKNHLTSIMGFSETLSNLDLPKEEEKKYLDIIASEAKQMNKLMEKFLDICRIEFGKQGIKYNEKK